MRTRPSHGCLILLGAACLLLASQPTLGAAAKPNIVFFLADDLGWTGVGCFGSDLHGPIDLRAVRHDLLNQAASIGFLSTELIAEQQVIHGVAPAAAGDEAEMGATQPGMTIVCGDSHTATHGAFGALAFGIGTTEVGHVLATQCLLQKKPRSFEIRVEGQLDRVVVQCLKGGDEL